MSVIDSKVYLDEINRIAVDLPVKKGNVLITGASGLIGSCITDVFIKANRDHGSDFRIFALGRNKEKLKKRFSYAKESLNIIEQNIISPLDDKLGLDYIIHAASNADPVSYALYPADTILTNFEGTKNCLEYCKMHTKTRLLFTSSFEVYGKHEIDEYSEDDFGALNINMLRSGYPYSKILSELLLRSYCEQYDVDAVIGRLSSIYGPTMLTNDSKAHAQFIRNGLHGENIVLKSAGTQRRTYCYVMDAVSGLFRVLFKGKTGEAYNIANDKSIATIAEVANTVAGICGTKVVFDLPSDIEKRGFSSPQNCVLNIDKLRALGWQGKHTLRDGLQSTINILREVDKKC